MDPELSAALRLLGPLEGRIMRLVWAGRLAEPFTVRDVHTRLQDLAYTTVMTTVARLAEKGLLATNEASHRRAYLYRLALPPAEFLRHSSEEQVDDLIARFGDVALAAFAGRLNSLPQAQRRRLGRRSRA